MRWITTIKLATATLLTLSSCTAPPPGPPEADHPASPIAETAPMEAPSSLLLHADPVVHTPPASFGNGDSMDHGQHEMRREEPEAHEPAGVDRPPPENEDETRRRLFVCPMHPHVTSAEPGECPECGMDLVPRSPRNS